MIRACAYPPCPSTFEVPGEPRPGRPRRFCSKSCKVAAWRLRDTGRITFTRTMRAAALDVLPKT